MYLRNGKRSPFFTSDKNQSHSTLYSLRLPTSLHFFIKFSTAPLIAFTPVRIVGSAPAQTRSNVALAVAYRSPSPLSISADRLLPAKTC